MPYGRMIRETPYRRYLMEERHSLRRKIISCDFDFHKGHKMRGAWLMEKKWSSCSKSIKNVPVVEKDTYGN